MANTFAADNAKGKTGERLVSDYLERKGYHVEDISSDYNNHTDLLLTRENGSKFLAEVKYDARICKTGNVFFEHIITYADGREEKGWIHKTKADYVFYIDAKSGRTYIFDWKRLYRILTKLEFKLPTKECNDGYKYMIGICIPPNDNRIKKALFGVIHDIRIED